MSMNDLVDQEALLDDEEDESFDEGAGQTAKEPAKANGYNDSSEEELDDDDEDAARAVSVFSVSSITSNDLSR